MRQPWRFDVVCLLGVALVAFSSPSAGQDSNYDLDQLREAVNRGTVMIQGAQQDSAFTRLANDIATVLDSDEIRVLPLLGKGSFENVKDLMFLKGVDATFTQADTLDFYKTIGVLPHLERDLRYIMRTSDEEFHLLAKAEFKSIYDLEGKKVNFGQPGTGTFTTSSVVFDKLGIKVIVTDYPHRKALALLRSGEIDALAKVDGKPVDVIAEANIDEGLRLMEVPSDDLREIYDGTEFTADDYPALIAAGDKVKSVSVASLLAVYNFPPDHPRAKKVDNFIQALFDKFDELQVPDSGHDAKWRDIDPAQEVPGWTRHRTASSIVASQ